MFNPFVRRAKTAPSSYPRVVFHAIRTAQLLSSLVEGRMRVDTLNGYSQLEQLTSASLFSIAALAFTILLHCFSGLNPRLNLAINAFLLILWTLSWCLLTWYMSGTLSNMCDIDHWNEDIGIMVCRIYKTLFTFTLTGFCIHPRYPDDKRPVATRGPFTDDGHQGSLPRESEAWEAPRPSLGPYSERGHGEYTVPDQQFEYDTGYHGHGGR
ncbi:uncharacterized protein MYCFIDRAFT_62733 [Pseudocercospora fijiensis CIRAD86]|uniref:MARVEL domain-containing protein n=1 Tax=Pseudocercospora fijiensis (strain CIRAD86) TaxID=383855 RepID=N1QB37_PSEFD|nr:uncharacterized protein MYCFIDRAFT_62733 [Pseudocercospora fijiensis CIRAD86]EME88268.1 hypothetical protein MYCFIDRAFT_62733 [Pseudocercospora fijiensis CIRAD86]